MKHRSNFLYALAAATCLVAPSLSLAGDSIRLLTGDASIASVPVREEVAAQLPIAVPDAGAQTAKAGKQPDAVDLAALYYYADQKQTARLEAESGRLRLKYPDFVVPADVYLPATARGIDEKMLWDLYDQDDFAGIDAEIGRRKAEAEDWNPTPDFTAKLARKKQRVTMTKAALTKDWMSVIAAGSTLDPKTETEVDLLWSLIDAYAQTGAKDRLPPIYQGILFRDKANTPLPDAVIVTTLQKATRDFPPADVRAVLQQFAANPGMQPALQSVSLDLLRHDMGAFNADETRLDPLAQDDVERLQAVALAQAKPADLSLLGWYHLKLKQPAASTPFFRKALAAEKNPDNAKGLYLSLAQQGLEEEAFQVAADHLQDLSDDPEFLMNALSLRFSRPELAVIDEKIVASYSTTILQTLNGDHGEILAWYAYNSRQFEAAEAWFGKAFDWEPEPARLKGLALSYLRLGRKADYADLEATYGPVYPEIWDEIKVASPPRGRRSAAIAKPRTIVETGFRKKLADRDFSGCIADLASLEGRRALAVDEQLSRGWCHMGLFRTSEARAAFAVALKGKGRVREDAAYGMALTLLRGSLTDEAESIVGMYPMTAARDREIRGEIYVQRARSAFELKQYQKVLDTLNVRASLVAEPGDLTQMRAWSHYHLGNRTTARDIFARLNMRFSDPALQAGVHAASANR